MWPEALDSCVLLGPRFATDTAPGTLVLGFPERSPCKPYASCKQSLGRAMSPKPRASPRTRLLLVAKNFRTLLLATRLHGRMPVHRVKPLRRDKPLQIVWVSRPMSHQMRAKPVAHGVVQKTIVMTLLLVGATIRAAIEGHACCWRASNMLVIPIR